MRSAFSHILSTLASVGGNVNLDGLKKRRKGRLAGDSVEGKCRAKFPLTVTNLPLRLSILSALLPFRYQATTRVCA